MRRRLFYLACLAYGLAVIQLVPELLSGPEGTQTVVVSVPDVPNVADPAPNPTDGAGWFASMKPFCNSVEAGTHVRWQPAPETFDGQAFEAACFALAGRIDRARTLISDLPEGERWRAAGIVFETGHPAADAGDETAAGALMELVVEFWPNHYMALYHAGAARFEWGDLDLAAHYLTRFLQHYSQDDGWRRNALTMIEEIPSS